MGPEYGDQPVIAWVKFFFFLICPLLFILSASELFPDFVMNYP